MLVAALCQLLRGPRDCCVFGCSVQDLGFRVQGLEFRFGPQGSWSTGLGYRVFLQSGAKDREWCFRP